MTEQIRPKLRRLQMSLGKHNGEPVVMIQDPLRLNEQAMAVSTSIAPFLQLCDGTRDAATLKVALELRAGIDIKQSQIEDIIDDLDKALLLENERFTQAFNDAVEKYRSAPSRPPALAGLVYPDSPYWLQRTLEEYGENICAQAKNLPASDNVRGLVSPHIDYQRGGPIYADVWRKATASAQAAEVVIILGTNHFDCQKLFTLTRQNYSTPWGVMNTAVDVVDALANSLGEEDVFAEELQHRSEHSVEAAAVWLHFVTRNMTGKLVPVLCGSLNHYIDEGGQPGNDEQVALFVDAIKKATSDRRTLIVAAADLAHVGPAFGDNYPIDLAQREKLSAVDGELMSAITSGDAEGMFAQVKNERDKWRVCGLTPIYIMLRLLGESSGEITGYAQCPADHHSTSFVSICGILLT